jgi:hypothetical protein
LSSRSLISERPDLFVEFLKEAKKDFDFKKDHKSDKGGLTEKGRKAYNKATGGNLKKPQPEGGKRRDSFCARMEGMKEHNTSAETARDPQHQCRDGP